MKRILSIQFINHPILRNLKLDFCNKEGRPVDTVILAGENGCGKSSILKALFDLVSRRPENEESGLQFEALFVLQIDDKVETVKYCYKPVGTTPQPFFVTEDGFDELVYSSKTDMRYPISGIYSDVDIVFDSSSSSTVTSLQLDEKASSLKSGPELGSYINQLIIDVQALDDADFAHEARMHPDIAAKDLAYDSRMHRFTDAFDGFFDDIKYDRVRTQAGCKEVVFKKHNQDIALDALSSGEKQIVYRGCFLLQNVNATREAFVFIDEPEISLHPSWQAKILNYYKSIFTDGDGSQTSQVFIATHSPFIIHNDNRRNDKVIVLSHNENGEIVVKDNPEYYKCNSIEAVQDAFSTSMLHSQDPTVYVEGRTDELYLNRAIDVLDIDSIFKVRWIGYLDENGQERNTGDKALTKGFEFCCAHPQLSKCAFLYDCDTKHEERSTEMVAAFTWPMRDSPDGMKRGIENLISFEGIELDSFYNTKEEIGDYGEKKRIESLNKMKLCEHICGLDDGELKNRFSQLRPALERLAEFFGA